MTVALFFALPCGLRGNPDSLLQVLAREISNRPAILTEKKAQFLAVHEKLGHARDVNETFEWQYELCSLYQSFSYDSAAWEAQKLMSLAHQTADPEKIARAKIKQSFILLSAGIFREALDSLAQVRVTGLSEKTKASFYHTRARGYLDLAAYCLDRYYRPLYNSNGMACLDSAIFYAKHDTIYFLSLSGLKALQRNDYTTGVAVYQALLRRPDLSTRQLAIEATSASEIFHQAGREKEAFDLLIIGAIADERSCVKESTALMKVAAYLFQKEDYERASWFINLALEDANFFGARLRKMQIVEILPLINARQLSLYKEKRNNLTMFSVILGVLLLVCIRLIVLILNQNRILKKKEQTISDSYKQLEAFALALSEADHIKEKYIGHFFQ